MSNQYEDWDDYDWQNHIRKVSREDFLATDKGKKWKKDKQRQKTNENLKYCFLIVIGVIILIIIIRAGGCSINSSNQPYRR